MNWLICSNLYWRKKLLLFHVCYDDFHPSQQFFSHVRSFPVFIGWTSTKQRNVSCSKTQGGATSEAKTRNPSICKQAFYQWAMALLSGINSFLTLNAPITTKVVCFSRLLKCLKSLYGKQCGPRSDSYRSSLFWVHAVCFYTQIVSNVRQLFAADDFSRRHFQMHFFLGALRVNTTLY